MGIAATTPKSATSERATPKGTEPLTPEDLEGLIPSYLSTKEDLNLAEAENIAKAHIRFRKDRKRYANLEVLLDDMTLRAIHKEMFGDVWAWAGSYRRRMTNIGVMPEQVPMRTRELCLNTLAMAEFCDRNNTQSCDELACRFHWELVRIHPFLNGNGRHARMVADLFAMALGRPAFTWGSNNAASVNTARATYLAAIQKANETRGDVTDLTTFARS